MLRKAPGLLPMVVGSLLPAELNLGKCFSQSARTTGRLVRLLVSIACGFSVRTHTERVGTSDTLDSFPAVLDSRQPWKVEDMFLMPGGPSPEATTVTRD